jgi:hypothetical protein
MQAAQASYSQATQAAQAYFSQATQAAQANFSQATQAAPTQNAQIPQNPYPQSAPVQNQAPPAPSRPTTIESFAGQSMRAAPIQDLPAERMTPARTAAAESIRRPDVLSRTNYGQQSPVKSSIPIGTNPGPQSTRTAQTVQAAQAAQAAQNTIKATQPVVVQQTPKVGPSGTITSGLSGGSSGGGTSSAGNVASLAEQMAARLIEMQQAQVQAQAQAQTQVQDDTTVQLGGMRGEEGKTNGKRDISYTELISQETEDGTSVANNALLLDIMQSLPPMPPPSAQPPQPVVLNGRALRSLGSVLLEGHLVPESRLEVAQNVQRMLRGVDLNYQLGEILLMFKLLTPDQLLAASLVSHGMITTTQISALGRIRQELHAIGLEYDLENLLIMFRILTPEQLREVKTSWQG